MNLGWQSRVRWTPRSGNDLFFAFNQGWIQEDTDSLRFKPQDSKISAKFQCSFRFLIEVQTVDNVSQCCSACHSFDTSSSPSVSPFRSPALGSRSHHPNARLPAS